MLNDFLTMFSPTALGLPPVGRFILIILAMVVCGLIVSVTYLFADKERIPSQSYALTLVILAPIVTIIVMMVGNNFASALSLGGAFALIRFRSVPSDPKDIAYVLFCMAIGLTGGIGLLFYAFGVTITLCLVMIALERFRFATPRRTRKTLKITIPENFNYQNAFEDIFEKYVTDVVQKKTRTTDVGSLFEITFDLTMSNDADEKAFIDELRTRNGNLPVVLVLGESQTVPVWI
jgi:hypothetical protein